MLTRFCLYGFLKNQRYFEPFILVALKYGKGLTFTEIGLLLAVDRLTMLVLEIPSGAIADLFGRRRSMILSFVAYFASFFVMGTATSFAAFCGAMVLFGVGEAFRSGTHKSMIFAWLKLEGREAEKTQVYGLTRSWSKFGSAASALIASGLVLATGSLNAVFYWSMVPCALSIVNLLGYPATIDPKPTECATVGSVFRLLRAALVEVLTLAPLRRLVFESMVFQGLFRSTKDYLQPALVTAMVLWFGAATDELEDPVRAAILVGPVYSVLFLLAGFASRRAHSVSDRLGGDASAARWLWFGLVLIFAALAAGSAWTLPTVTIAGFIAMHVTQNVWRPILTSRIYETIDASKATTVLSIESQFFGLATIVMAPLFGWLVDSNGGAFWPVAVVGGVLALTCGILRRS